MNAIRIALTIGWIAFWAYWLVSAVGVKKGRRSNRRIPLNGVTAVAAVLVLRVFHSRSLAVHSVALGAIGAALFASGIAVAIWARIHLGSNWGMPMDQKAEPELVTSGPYRLVRHPIYSGLLLALFGTALATNLAGLILAPVVGGYFLYSASVEEKNLTGVFPEEYPAYRSRTKMIIPFVL